MTLRIEAGESAIGRMRDRLREPTGLAGREIALDDLAEDLAGAVVQLRDGAGFSAGEGMWLGTSIRCVWPSQARTPPLCAGHRAVQASLSICAAACRRRRRTF